MITSFLESWALFHWTYLGALLLAVALGTFGVLVVLRGQVFVAAAVAQASVLGVALSLALGWASPAFAATALSGVAALATAGRRHRGGRTPDEVTGWLFLVAGSAAVLVLARHPVGLKAVQSLAVSSVIGLTGGQVAMFGGMAVLALGLAAVARPRLVLLITDPTMAAAVGMRPGRWSVALALALGLGTAVALQATGLLFTFGCLVLPALIAKNLCREVAPMFWVAPLVAAGAALAGLVLAHHFDFPPGQMIVELLAAGLVLAWGWRAARGWLWG
jgi:ABC-type Mn2+/Zn2+ transport system permease subunit